MNIKELKKELDLSNKDIAEFFGLKNEGTYLNSSAKLRYDKALCNFYDFVKTMAKELANWIYYEEEHTYYCFECVEKRMEEINNNKEFSKDIDFEGGNECGYFQGYADEDCEVKCSKCGKPLFSTGVDS